MTSLVKRTKKSKRVSLASAASQSNGSLVQELINDGEEVNGHDSDGFTALHRACAIGDTQVVQVLLKNGADPNIPDSCGDTSLHWACFCGHVSTVELLLENGADPHVPSSDGKTAMDAARDEGHTGIVRALKHRLEAGSVSLSSSASPENGAHGKNSSVGSSGNQFIMHAAGKIVPGMNFIAEIEGPLKKRSKNTLLGTKMWRSRYFLVSEHFCGLFVWLGSEKTQVDQNVKFFPYELFYKCSKTKASKSDKRFNLNLTNGRNFLLQAENADKCEEWVRVLNTCGGRNMAVLRIQQCWRHFWSRKRFVNAIAASRAKRKKGVDLVKHQRRGSTDTSITRGPLKKKDYHGSTNVTKLWRNRFFVIDHQKGELRYYDNRTKEKIGYRPRVVKFEQLISIYYPKKKQGGRQFIIRVTDGRTYELSAAKRLLAQQWVTSLMQLLPAENVAALHLQAKWRAHVIYKKFHQTIVDNLKKKREAAATQERQERNKAKQLKDDAKLKRANEQAAARRNRLNRLKKVKSEQKKTTGETKEGKDVPKMSRMARLKAAKVAKKLKMLVKKNKAERLAEEARLAKLKEDEAAAKAALAAQEAQEVQEVQEVQEDTPEPDPEPSSPWTEYETEDGTKYYHNAETGETRWDKPEELMSPDEKLAAANRAAQVAAMEMESDASESDESDSDSEGEEGGEDDVNSDWRNWSIVIDEQSGREYYVNNVTNETRWVCPNCMLKEGWDSSKDDQGRVYYYHTETSDTSWAPPYRKECDPLYQPGKPYNEQETYVFTNMIGQLLNCTMDVGTDPHVLYSMAKSGLVLGRLINTIAPDTLDERALNGITIDDEDNDLDDDATTSNMTVEELSKVVLQDPEKATENHQLCMNSLNTLGIQCDMDVLNPAHMALGDPYCLNELCYLLLRHSAQSMLDVTRNKHVFALCEDPTDKNQTGKMRTMTGTDILHLWVEHMAPGLGGCGFIAETNKGQQGQKGEGKGGSGVGEEKEGEEEEEEDVNSLYTVDGARNLTTATAVAKRMFGGTAVEAVDGEKGAGESKAHGGVFNTSLETTLNEQNVCNWFYEANHLTCGRVMEIVVSLMFKHKSTLRLAEVEQAEMVEEDPSLSRESRTYKTWITSLLVNIEGSKNIRDLVEDLRDGELLIKMVALITAKEPSVTVDWKRVNSNTSSRFKQVENVNYLLELCSKLNLNLTNIGSLDIIDRNPKILHALLYRLLRFHSLQIVTQALGGQESGKSLQDVDEKAVVQWVNDKIASSDEGSSKMKSFRDPENKNSVMFMDLLEAMRVRIFCCVGLLGLLGVVVGSGGKWREVWSICVVGLCGRGLMFYWVFCFGFLLLCSCCLSHFHLSYHLLHTARHCQLGNHAWD